MLLLSVVIPALFGLGIAAWPARFARRLATIGSLVFFAITLGVVFTFDWGRTDEFQFLASYALGGDVGPALLFGVDGVAAMLLLLAGFLAPLCVIGSFSAITERERAFYGWLMALQGAMAAVFVARDIVTFYVGFEFTLIPMFVLISLFGSTNRKYAAVKFFLFTFAGSILTLAGLLYVAWTRSLEVGAWDFSIAGLMETARGLSAGEQGWVLFAMLAGFAVKTPLFPVHTWLPLAHTEAPTAGSVVLAGVLLKLGTYGLYRFVLPFLPVAVVEWAPLIAGVSIVGILYGGLICWVQRDVKKLVAYSSVAHLGFCVLGLFSLNAVGGAGSVMYMINHGLSTGALFFCVGMMYERYHTRSLEEVGGLAKRMPVWSFFMVYFAMASVGLPGLNGFISEFMCLMGTFQSGATFGVGGTTGPLGPWYAAIAGVGMIVAAMYLLYMVGAIVFGPLREPHAHDDHGHGHHHVSDLTKREIGVLAPLALACLVLGVYPTPVLRALEAPVGVTLAGVDEVKSTNAATRTAGVIVVEEASR
ncbi:MAG: NuoM family protein [Phycisphaerales bacterium]